VRRYPRASSQLCTPQRRAASPILWFTRTYDEIPDIVAQWYSGLRAGLSLPVPADDQHDERLAEVTERCKDIPTPGNRCRPESTRLSYGP
jgi:hypothetical protein